MLEDCSPTKTNLQRIGFVNCSFEIPIARFEYGDSSWQWSYCVEHLIKTISKDTTVKLLRDEFERRTGHLDLMEFYEGVPNNYKYHDMLDFVHFEIGRQWCLEWCLTRNGMARALLWPYPDSGKQMRWLKTSLDTLDERTKERLSKAYHSYNAEARQ